MAAREEETGNIQHRQKDRAAVVPVVLIVLLSSATGIVLGLLIDWFPTPASTQADPIDTLWDVLVIASVPIFVGVQAFVLYCVWRFRMRPGRYGVNRTRLDRPGTVSIFIIQAGPQKLWSTSCDRTWNWTGWPSTT